MTNRPIVLSSRRLILASASPARAKLLREAGFDPVIMPVDLDEDKYKQTISDPETLVKTLAREKAYTCLNRILTSEVKPAEGRENLGGLCILAADTIVVCDDEIIGKPLDRADAQRIITSLAGHTHQVWTGVCIIQPQRLNRLQAEKTSEVKVFAEKSNVTFKSMTDEEIEAYLDTGEWVDKAGGYQIQKTMGQYVDKVEGDFANIIGIPMNKTKQKL